MDKNICKVCFYFLKLNLTGNGQAVTKTYNKIWDAWVSGKKSITVRIHDDKISRSKFEERMQKIGLRYNRVVSGVYRVYFDDDKTMKKSINTSKTNNKL